MSDESCPRWPAGRDSRSLGLFFQAESTSNPKARTIYNRRVGFVSSNSLFPLGPLRHVLGSLDPDSRRPGSGAIRPHRTGRPPSHVSMHFLSDFDFSKSTVRTRPMRLYAMISLKMSIVQKKQREMVVPMGKRSRAGRSRPGLHES